jgi:hypothetical protein
MEKGALELQRSFNWHLSCESLQMNKCGWKQKYNSRMKFERLVFLFLLVPIHRKETQFKLASAIGVPLGTLHQMKEDKDDNVIAPHSNTVRPYLQDHHIADDIMIILIQCTRTKNGFS